MGASLGAQSVDCMPDGSEEWSFDEVFTNKNSLGSDAEACESNTVVIFDWDDTLLCSTAVRLQEWGIEHLQELELAIEAILRTAMSLGETLIVTNGNATWVQDSAQRFLPGLLPVLSQLRIVSARALYEDTYPGDPFMWKHAAFEQLLTKERHFPAEPGLNLIALGDQFPEIDAARHVGRVIGGSSAVKTVKFQEAPSVDALLGQLSRAEQMLSTIVKETEDQSYGLVQRELPPFFNSLASSAAAWHCVTEADCVYSCADPVVGVKDCLGFVN